MKCCLQRGWRNDIENTGNAGHVYRFVQEYKSQAEGNRSAFRKYQTGARCQHNCRRLGYVILAHVIPFISALHHSLHEPKC